MHLMGFQTALFAHPVSPFLVPVLDPRQLQLFAVVAVYGVYLEARARTAHL